MCRQHLNISVHKRPCAPTRMRATDHRRVAPTNTPAAAARPCHTTANIQQASQCRCARCRSDCSSKPQSVRRRSCVGAAAAQQRTRVGARCRCVLQQHRQRTPHHSVDQPGKVEGKLHAGHTHAPTRSSHHAGKHLLLPVSELSTAHARRCLRGCRRCPPNAKSTCWRCSQAADVIPAHTSHAITAAHSHSTSRCARKPRTQLRQAAAAVKVSMSCDGSAHTRDLVHTLTHSHASMPQPGSEHAHAREKEHAITTPSLLLHARQRAARAKGAGASAHGTAIPTHKRARCCNRVHRIRAAPKPAKNDREAYYAVCVTGTPEHQLHSTPNAAPHAATAKGDHWRHARSRCSTRRCVDWAHACMHTCKRTAAHARSSSDAGLHG